MAQRVEEGLGAPPLNDTNVVLALMGSKTTGGLHIGVGFYEEADGAWKFIHHGWHRSLYCGTLPDSKADYIWVFPILDKYEAIALRTSCHLVVRNNRFEGGVADLAYAFSSHHRWLRQIDALIEPPEGGIGLTCASFVLALFEHASLSPVDLRRWPKRKRDRQAQEQLCQLLSKRHPEHADSVRAEIGNVRVRPEEVAGAALCSDWPVPFSRLRGPARYVMERAFTLFNRVRPAEKHLKMVPRSFFTNLPFIGSWFER